MKALAIVTALTLSACTSGGLDANKSIVATGARAIVGTSLVGAQGKTRADDRAIGGTVARLCETGVWTKAECRRHGIRSKRK